MPVRLVSKKKRSRHCYYTIFKSSWGYLGLSCRGDTINLLVLPRQSEKSVLQEITRDFQKTISNEINDLLVRDDNLQPSLKQSLIDYFAGQKIDFDCRVDVGWASEFGQKVLACCCKIKPGITISYKHLASLAHRERASRAVGMILAGNHVPLLVPCHRVVRSDGSLGGYSAAGGVKLKKRLLDHESAFL